MELSQSKLLSSLLLLVLVLANPSRSLGQASTVSKLPVVVLSPVQRLPTDSDRVIRDFVQLLHPDWDNAAWDLVITGKRSMNPNFGVDRGRIIRRSTRLPVRDSHVSIQRHDYPTRIAIDYPANRFFHKLADANRDG